MENKILDILNQYRMTDRNNRTALDWSDFDFVAKEIAKLLTHDLLSSQMFLAGKLEGERLADSELIEALKSIMYKSEIQNKMDFATVLLLLESINVKCEEVIKSIESK